MDVLTLLAKLGIDTSEYDKGLQSASSKMNSFGGALKSGFGTIAKVGMAAVGAATTAAAGFAKTAMDSAISYETAFTGVKKTVDETINTTYEDLSNAIKKMATETASTQEEIAGVMEAAGQLGINADDIEGFTKTMVMLGDTTNLAADEAAVALAHFTNITGESSANVDKLGAAIVDLGNHFATDEASIVEMSTRLASAGTLAGLTSTDILALSTAMSSVGINAEAGGTAMSQSLTKISNAVANGVDESNTDLYMLAEVADMTAEEFSDAWGKDPVHAMSAFIKGLDHISERGGNVNGILDELGMKGIRESNTLRSLALASDVLDDAIETSSRAYEENMALTEEANKRYQTMESRISQMKAAFQNLKITIGEELTPSLGEFVDFGKTSMMELAAAFQEGGLSGAMDKLGEVLAEGIAMVTEKIPEMIDAGMQLLGALGQGLIDNAPQLFDAFLQIGGMLGSAALELFNSVDDAIVNFDWAGLPEKIMPLISKGLMNALRAINVGSSIVSHLASGIGEALPQLLPLAVRTVVFFANSVIEQAPKLIEAAFQLIQGLAEGIINSIPVLIESIPQLVTGLVTALISFKTNFMQTAIDLFMSFVEAMPDIISSITEALPELIDGIVNALIAGTPQMIQAYVQLFMALVEAIPQITVALIAAMPQIIVALITGIGEGVMSIVEAVAPMAMEFVNIAVQTGQQVIASVQAWLAELPTNIAYGIGLAVGQFAATIIQLPQKAQETWENIKQGVSDFATQFAEQATQMAKNFYNNLVNNIQQLPSRLRALGQQLIGAIKDLPSRFAEVGREIVDGLWRGISSGWSWLTSQVKSLADSLLQGVKDGLQIHSPSKVFANEVGKWIPAGIAVGIQQNSGVLTKAIDDLIQMPDLSTFVKPTSAEETREAGGFIQNLTINSPRALDPSETARLNRNASREMMLQLRMA